MATPLKRFVLPAWDPAIGPPPILGPQELGGPPDLGPVIPDPVSLDIRRQIAMDSPTGDWMYEPYQPDPAIARTVGTPQFQGVPPSTPRPGPGGLMRALGKIIPIARDLGMGAAAGASAPTAVEGLGAGISQNMAQRAAEQKASHDWTKMQIEAAKAGAEIEKFGAESRKMAEETRLMQPRQQSQAELQAAQATAARELADLNKARAKHQQAVTQKYPQMAEAQVKELAARATRQEWESKRTEAYLAAGIPAAEAKLRAAQEYRTLAEAELAQARVENYPQEVQNETIRSQAFDRQSLAALARSKAQAQAGQLRPADRLRALSTMKNLEGQSEARRVTAVGKIQAIEAYKISEDPVKAEKIRQQWIAQAEKEHKEAIGALRAEFEPYLNAPEEDLGEVVGPPDVGSAGSGTWEDYKRSRGR